MMRAQRRPERADHVAAIRDILFLQDDLRLRSATYAIIPFVDLTRRPSDTEHLEDVQAVIAYCYASPRHEFGDLFLSSDRACLVIFSPGPVPLAVVRPSFHVTAVGQLVRLAWSLVFFYYYQVKASVVGKSQSGSM